MSSPWSLSIGRQEVRHPGAPFTLLVTLIVLAWIPVLGAAQGPGFTGVAPPGLVPLPGGPGSQPAVESIRKRFLPQPDAPPLPVPGQPLALPGRLPGSPAVTGEESPVQARLGARVERPGAALRTQLDLPEGQGLILEEVRKGTPAARAGLQTHDILLELDGHSVPSSPMGLAQLLARVREDQPVDIVVMRLGRSETIKSVKFPLPGTLPGGQPGAVLPPGRIPDNVPLPVPGDAAVAAVPPMPLLPPGMTPPGPFPVPPMPVMAGPGVITVLYRNHGSFVTRHQEGNLIITLTGSTGGGKAKVEGILVQDGPQNRQYSSPSRVSAAYRTRVQGLIDMTEKCQAGIDLKTP